jgi:hypothetical protein
MIQLSCADLDSCDSCSRRTTSSLRVNSAAPGRSTQKGRLGLQLKTNLGREYRN